MQAEHEHAAVALCLIQRLIDGRGDAPPAGLERMLEGARMPKEGFRLCFVHAVIGFPEPQVGLGQRLAQRLRACDRHQPLLVGSAEQNGDTHHVRSIPMRLISQCNSIPDVSLTRLRTVSPNVSISCPVALPVLIKKLQCIAETCAPPTRRPRQPAASISFHALLPGGFLKVEPPVFSRIGCAVSRWVCTSFMRARIASGAAGLPRKRAEVKMIEGSTPELR